MVIRKRKIITPEEKIRVDVEKFKGKKYQPMYWYPNKLFSFDPKKYFFYIAIVS